MPLTELENKAVDLKQVFGEKGKVLEEEILSGLGNLQRIQSIGKFLLSHLNDPKAIDNITKSCVEAIFLAQGQLAVMDLAGSMKINRRNMERKFISTVGIAPNSFQESFACRVTLKMLEQKKYTSLTSLAYEAGYYDQAHFIKDFKEFTGMSPKSFFADNMKLSALFIAAG